MHKQAPPPGGSEIAAEASTSTNSTSTNSNGNNSRSGGVWVVTRLSLGGALLGDDDVLADVCAGEDRPELEASTAHGHRGRTPGHAARADAAPEPLTHHVTDLEFALSPVEWLVEVIETHPDIEVVRGCGRELGRRLRREQGAVAASFESDPAPDPRPFASAWDSYNLTTRRKEAGAAAQGASGRPPRMSTEAALAAYQARPRSPAALETAAGRHFGSGHTSRVDATLRTWEDSDGGAGRAWDAFPTRSRSRHQADPRAARSRPAPRRGHTTQSPRW